MIDYEAQQIIDNMSCNSELVELKKQLVEERKMSKNNYNIAADYRDKYDSLLSEIQTMSLKNRLKLLFKLK